MNVLDRRRATRGGRRGSDVKRLQKALDASLQVHALRPQVLVVDDYRDGREMLAEYLRFRGFQVSEASSGSEALSKCMASRPDVVILDLALPDVDGLEVAAQLKRSQTPAPRIVVWTAHVFGDIRQRVSAAADMFIPKPCDIQLVALPVACVAGQVPSRA